MAPPTVAPNEAPAAVPAMGMTEPMAAEMVKENSWGQVPPTLTVETTGTKGWQRSGTHSEKAPGASGGTLDYGAFREALQQTVSNAGWRFEMEGGRAP